MTVQDIYNKILAMIDQYTEDGVDISSAENIDIEKKVILFVDSAQKELWKQNKKTSQVSITNKPPINLLDNADTYEDFKETVYYPDSTGTPGAQGYSIQVNEEASDNATITLQELVGATWTDLVTITPTSITELTTYTGVLTLTSTSNQVRLKLEGTEHYLHKNRALWQYKYKAASVPIYEQWVKYDMPTDFNGLDVVIEEFPFGQYYSGAPYKIENYRDFYYAFDYEGEIRITYKPIPTTVTALTDTIEIDDVLAEAIVYDVVSKLGFYENPDLVNWSEGRRLEAKMDASANEVPAPDIVVDFYG